MFVLWSGLVFSKAGGQGAETRIGTGRATAFRFAHEARETAHSPFAGKKREKMRAIARLCPSFTFSSLRQCRYSMSARKGAP